MAVLKANYHGFESRKNLYEVRHDDIQKNASSVACVVDKNYLQKRPGGFFELVNYDLLHERLRRRERVHLDAKERFLQEPAASMGTVFLVGKRYVFTVAHLVCKPGTSELDYRLISVVRIIFGFRMQDAQKCVTHFEKRCVYHIESVVDYRWSREGPEWADWACLELDRDVEGIEPLALNYQAQLQKESDVYMLGYPSGLPLKYTGDAKVIDDGHPHRFKTNLDAYHGNSGSPVFHQKTHEVVGILAEGHPDYVVNRFNQLESFKPAEGGPDLGETCQRLNAVAFLHAAFIRYTIIIENGAAIALAKPAKERRLLLDANSHFVWKHGLNGPDSPSVHVTKNDRETFFEIIQKDGKRHRLPQDRVKGWDIGTWFSEFPDAEDVRKISIPGDTPDEKYAQLIPWIAPDQNGLIFTRAEGWNSVEKSERLVVEKVTSWKGVKQKHCVFQAGSNFIFRDGPYYYVQFLSRESKDYFGIWYTPLEYIGSVFRIALSSMMGDTQDKEEGGNYTDGKEVHHYYHYYVEPIPEEEHELVAKIKKIPLLAAAVLKGMQLTEKGHQEFVGAGKNWLI